MRKALKFGSLLLVLFFMWYMISVIADSISLNEKILRLHVVANSDSVEDQTVKLKVRDAVIEKLQHTVSASDKSEAMEQINGILLELEETANDVLRSEGFSDRAVVHLDAEEFPTRFYDTFTLPAGVYDSLRITIGEGEGQNWWCVVFPSLCVPAAAAEMEDVAVGAGFSETLSGAISNEGGYEVRFFFLDCLGRLQNLFHFQ